MTTKPDGWAVISERGWKAGEPVAMAYTVHLAKSKALSTVAELNREHFRPNSHRIEPVIHNDHGWQWINR